jgi:hypothetical protein
MNLANMGCHDLGWDVVLYRVTSDVRHDWALGVSKVCPLGILIVEIDMAQSMGCFEGNS